MVQHELPVIGGPANRPAGGCANFTIELGDAGGGIVPGLPFLTAPGVGLYHSGGNVRATAPRRRVSALAFAGAPRLHNGLMSDEFPAILQKGELVIPKAARRGAGTVDNSRTYLGDVGSTSQLVW